MHALEIIIALNNDETGRLSFKNGSAQHSSPITGEDVEERDRENDKFGYGLTAQEARDIRLHAQEVVKRGPSYVLTAKQLSETTGNDDGRELFD